MGLIIKDKLQKMFAGYPTVSDKYNVAGGILTGSTPIKFGDLVKHTSDPGYFEPATSLSGVSDIGGIALATNVKLAEGFATNQIQINPGEAFNLFIDGFIAMELDSGATTSYVAPNAQVCVILSTGKLTTSDKYSSGTIEYLPNAVFTGTYDSTLKIAEVYIK